MEIKGPEYYAAWRAQQAEKRNAPPAPLPDRGSQVRDRNPVPDNKRQIDTAEEELRQMQGRLDEYIRRLSSPYRPAYNSPSEQTLSLGITSLERSIREKKAKIAELKSQTPSSTRNV